MHISQLINIIEWAT